LRRDSDFLFWLVWFDLEPEMSLFAEYLHALEKYLESEIQEHSGQLEEIRRKRLQLLRQEMDIARRTERQTAPLTFDSYFPTSEEEVIYLERQMLDRFSTILRRSFFVAVYSAVEAQLNRLCRYLEKQRNLPIPLEKVNNPSDRSIERAKKYLVVEAKVDFPESEEWNRLVAHKSIRNQVVHNEGLLPSDEQFQRLSKRKKERIEALRKYILGHPYLTLSAPYSSLHTEDYQPEIVFHKGFCEEVVATGGDFFQELNEAVYAQLVL
jgi:hypothetical protein